MKSEEEMYSLRKVRLELIIENMIDAVKNKDSSKIDELNKEFSRIYDQISEQGDILNVYDNCRQSCLAALGKIPIIDVPYEDSLSQAKDYYKYIQNANRLLEAVLKE